MASSWKSGVQSRCERLLFPSIPRLFIQVLFKKKNKNSQAAASIYVLQKKRVTDFDSNIYTVRTNIDFTAQWKIMYILNSMLVQYSVVLDWTDNELAWHEETNKKNE